MKRHPPLPPSKAEFVKLFARSGWSQAEAARHLDLTRGGMHGIIRGDTVPSRGLLKLFRLVLVIEKPEIFQPEMAVNGALRDPRDHRAEELWKARALDAEKRLERLRSSLRNLLDESSVPCSPEKNAGK